MVLYLRPASAVDIARLIADPAAAEDFVFPDDDPGLIDFDKAWRELHVLLTGEDYGTGHPLGIIAEETPLIETGGIGAFSFSVVTPERMAVFAAALAAVDDDTLVARYGGEGVPALDDDGDDADPDDDTDALSYILQGMPALRIFAADCAAAGDGAIRTLS